MTAAPETLTALPRSAYASGAVRTLRHWERALIVLAVCLPVPVFAATGLSIPLPSTVERLAAALVPWADTASFAENEGLAVGADGAIVLAPEELAGTQVAQNTLVAEVTTNRDDAATKTDRKPSRKKKNDGTGSGGAVVGGGGAASNTGDGSGGGGTSTGSGGSGGGGDSGSTPGPVQSVVDEATQATQPVVGAVEETIDETVDTTTGVVGGVDKTVGGVLPVQGP